MILLTRFVISLPQLTRDRNLAFVRGLYRSMHFWQGKPLVLIMKKLMLWLLHNVQEVSMKGHFLVYENERLAKSGSIDNILVFVPFTDYPDILPGDVINISVKSYDTTKGETKTNAEIKVVSRRYSDSGHWDMISYADPLSMRGLVLTFV